MLALAAIIAWCGCEEGGGGPGAPDQWTMLGHDYRSSFTNPAETALSLQNVHELRQLWELDAGGQVYGAPVVVDRTVYINSTGGLYALDGDSGAVLWKNAEVRATSALFYSEGTLFAHDFGALLRALDATTGEEKWETRTDAHRLATGLSSPIVFERYVVVGLSSNEIVREGATFRGGVAAFDRETGEQLWRDYTANPPHNGASVWSTVAIDTEARVVFAGSGQNYTGEAGPDSDALFALALDTGERLWTTQTVMGDVFTPINPRGPDADFGANPILFEADIDGESRALVGAGQKNGKFWALDRRTGEPVWDRTLGPGSPLTGGVLNNGAFDGTRILVANNSAAAQFGTLFALNPSDGATIWERPLPGWVWAPITVANGVGFVAADKNLLAFDTATGDVVFMFATDGTIACGASIAGGRVHVGSGMQHIVGTVNRKLHVLALPGDTGGPRPTPSPSPSAATTFSSIYHDIFVAQGCNTPLCHGGDAGGLSMATQEDAYTALVGVAATGEPCAAAGLLRVTPGDAAASLLWDKVSQRNPSCGDPMPIATALSAQDMQRIRDWIERGAPDD
jgi:polyvinyl alcohol dehydrogenase (cytochrome)